MTGRDVRKYYTWFLMEEIGVVRGFRMQSMEMALAEESEAMHGLKVDFA